MRSAGSRMVLVVDDSEDDIILLRGALARAGARDRVIAAHDGLEALELLRREAEPPALVLLDVRMPLMNGIETLRAMRADPRLRRVPVIMLTSSRQPGDIRECYERGANAYVVKPIEASDFDEAVAAIHRFWLSANEPPPT